MQSVAPCFDEESAAFMSITRPCSRTKEDTSYPMKAVVCNRRHIELFFTGSSHANPTGGGIVDQNRIEVMHVTYCYNLPA